jgi:hypothetical protein
MYTIRREGNIYYTLRENGEFIGNYDTVTEASEEIDKINEERWAKEEEEKV